MFDFEALDSTSQPNPISVRVACHLPPLALGAPVLAEPRPHPHSPDGRSLQRRNARGGREPVLGERRAVPRGAPRGGGGAAQLAEGRGQRPRGGVREPREAGAAVAGEHAAVARARAVAARDGEGGAGAEASERAAAEGDQGRGEEAAGASGQHGVAA